MYNKYKTTHKTKMHGALISAIIHILGEKIVYKICILSLWTFDNAVCVI